ncbi:hypothetical protein MRQ36_13655 [Micromonospora sp. R77]|uniref:hypothetical protein n=1 Tax=Micromonospora sp. R77 TaxID=2925836 RepID=UPI001F6095A4|nr:hypothetical protein [Micromonospora sp. R77]MCI4063572.1 hypothetical protein [Micromonospora sp. R77]
MPWLSAAVWSSGTVSARSSAAGAGTSVLSEPLTMPITTQGATSTAITSQVCQVAFFEGVFPGGVAEVVIS